MRRAGVLAIALAAGACRAAEPRALPEAEAPGAASSAAAAVPASAPARATARGAEVVFRDGDPPAFAEDAQAILSELEDWRGLPFLRDVVVDVVPPSDVADAKLAGWYEPSTKRLVVVEGRSDRMGRGTLLHEMFHALQDQHFDLARLHRDAARAGDDAERALQALIEGEAMLAVSERMDYDFEQHAHLPEEGPLDAARFEKIFHYGHGLRFARALRAAGGWERVDAAFASPPRATAEIYRPERALDRAPAVELAALPEAADLLPDGAGAAPRGAYALHLALAGPEDVRARSLEIASHLVQDLAWTDGDALAWLCLFDDPDAARALAEAAPSLGALEPALVRGALVRLRLPL